MTRPTLLAVAALTSFLLPGSPARADWSWPVRGEVITSYRNGNDPYAAGQHRGIDIAGEIGAAVVAATGGEVRFAGTAGSSGLTVSIRTADGRYDTSYLHLASTAVRKGQRVATGEVVGAVGTSGVRSTERPHLHFGIRDAGSVHAYHDPLAFLPPLPPGAPERPHEVPGPSPAPIPLAPNPAPAPVRVPEGRRAPIPRRAPTPREAPEPRRVPAVRPAPTPRGAPIPHRAPIPRSVPVPEAAPKPGREPAGRRAPTPRLAPSPRAALAPLSEPAGRVGPASRSALAPHRAGPAMPSASRGPSPGSRPQSGSDSGGLDLGWALACAGLLLAAGLLGLSEDGRKVTRTRSRQLSALLRPRLGRR